MLTHKTPSRNGSSGVVSALEKLVLPLPLKSYRAILAAGLGTFVMTSQGFGVTGPVTWSGSSGTGWTSAGNWIGGAAPTSASGSTGGIPVFAGDATATNNPSLTSNQGVYGLVFASGGWTIGGSSYTLTIGGKMIDASAQTSGTNTINASVVINSSGTWTIGNGAALLFNNNISDSGATLTIGSAGVSEGTVIFNHDSTRVKNTTLAAGTIMVGSNAALGSGTLILSGLTGSTAASKLALGSYGGTHTISNNVTIQAATEFVGTDELDFTGSVTISSGKTLTANNGNKVVFSGTAGINIGVLRIGAGTGTIVLANTGASGVTGNVTINAGGKLQIGNGGTAGSLIPGGSITNNGDLIFSRSDTITQGTDFETTITGAGNVTQAGSGTVVFRNNNTYTGLTNVTSGKLLVSGTIANSGTTTVSAGATLASGHNVTSYVRGGNLTSDNTSAVKGGILAAGNTGGTADLSTIGKLTIDGALTLGSGSTVGDLGKAHLEVELGGALAGTEYDQIRTTGAVSLVDVNLDVSFVNSFTAAGAADASDIFFIMVNDGSLTGAFANATGNTITIDGELFNISYTADYSTNTFSTVGGNDIALMAAVPEPQTWAMMAGGVGMLFLFGQSMSRRRSES